MNIFSDIHELTNNNTPFVFCIVIETEGSSPQKAGAKMLVLSNGIIKGTIGGGNIEKSVTEDALGIFKTGIPLKKTYDLSGELKMQCGGKMTIYMEPVFPREQLIIFGAGHIGYSLAKIASLAGFRVTVADERPGIFRSWQPGIAETTEAPFSESISKIEFHKNCYIVVCTHLHTSDAEVISQCINKTYRYIGMIGSSRKIGLARKRFADEFKMSEEQINRIDMPIGIPIKCESPADIAISIIAKLIDIKNGQVNES